MSFFGNFFISFTEYPQLINEFLPYVNNWSVCDSMVRRSKVFTSDLEKLFIEVKNWLNSKEIYHIRFGIITMMSYFLNDEYIDEVITILDNLKRPTYMAKMGIEVVNFNIQSFSDDNKVIENLGIDNISQISKDAAISKANAEKEIAVAKAEAAQASNEAKVKAETEIAKRQNELEIQKAELKREADIKRAEADAAYSIQEEEQRKTIEIATANANLARQEKEIELREREVAITEKTLEAEIKKKAEADKYAG